MTIFLRTIRIFNYVKVWNVNHYRAHQIKSLDHRQSHAYIKKRDKQNKHLLQSKIPWDSISNSKNPSKNHNILKIIVQITDYMAILPDILQPPQYSSSLSACLNRNQYHVLIFEIRKQSTIWMTLGNIADLQIQKNQTQQQKKAVTK